MNQFQIHKLNLAVNDATVHKDIRTYIRMLLAERMELLQLLDDIRLQSTNIVGKAQGMK